MATLDEVRKIAMQLSPEERSELLEDLVDSLKTDEEHEIEAEWIEEAERRLEDYRAGRMEVVSHEEALAHARAAIEEVRLRSRTATSTPSSTP